jgi:hypothetical protein
MDGHSSKFDRSVSKLNVADVILATVAMLLEFAPKYDPLYKS